MTAKEKTSGNRGGEPRPGSDASSGLLAGVAMLTGAALVIAGVLLFTSRGSSGDRPVEGALLTGYGLFWLGMGTSLWKNPKLVVMSMAALFSLVTVVCALLFKSAVPSDGWRWVVVLWAVGVNVSAVAVFYKSVMASNPREGSLPGSFPLRLVHLVGASWMFCLQNTSFIAWRETKRYFRSPSSYIILALFLLYQGLVFYIAVRFLNDPRAPHGAPMKFFFGGPFWFWPLECFIIAIITMDTLAEEQIRRTIEPLMTSPVNEVELVIGKFLGAFGFFVFLWAWTFLYVLVMVAHTEGAAHSTILEIGLFGGFAGLWAVLYVATRKGLSSGITAFAMTAVGGIVTLWTSTLSLDACLKIIGFTGIPVAALAARNNAALRMKAAKKPLEAVVFLGFVLLAVVEVMLIMKLFREAGPNAPNMGPIVSGYLGALYIGAAGIALGILYSSLTRDLKLACMLTFVSLFLLIIIKIMLLPELNLVETEWVRNLLEYVNFFDYMADFSRGIVDTRQLILLGTIVLVCLFAAARAVQSFKWR